MLVEVLLQHIFSPSNTVLLDAVGKKLCVGVQVDVEGQDLAHTHTANDREDAVFDMDRIHIIAGFHTGAAEAGLGGMWSAEKQLEPGSLLACLLDTATAFTTPQGCM